MKKLIATSLTINLKSDEGKYFVKHILPECKHPVYATPDHTQGIDWVEYVMDVEDYDKCRELMKRFEES